MFIEQGGLEASFDKHAKASCRLYSKLEANGFKMFLPNQRQRVPSVTSVIVPNGVDPLKITTYAMKKYKFEVAGGLGPTMGKIFRIGLMGNNATDDLVDKTVDVIIEAIEATKDEDTKSKI